MHNKTELLEALSALGELLAFRAIEADIAVIGGSALLLRDLSTRVTRDVDVVGLVDGNDLVDAQMLSSDFLDAVRDVALDRGLEPDWINPGPTDLLTLGLPAGFLGRSETIQFGGLTVRVADRFDQIHFKLYAAADHGPSSKHTKDLELLQPTTEELQAAEQWVHTHDPSPGFAASVQAVIGHLGQVDDGP